MADISAKDVKALRDATGAGMLDAKKALVENDGDFDAAARWLRERGLGKAAERSGRDNAEGTVALALAGDAGALVQLQVGDRLRRQVASVRRPGRRRWPGWWPTTASRPWTNGKRPSTTSRSP